MILLSLTLVGGAGWLLAGTVAKSQTQVLQDFDTRADVAASLIASTLEASDAKTRELGRSTFSGFPGVRRHPPAGAHRARTRRGRAGLGRPAGHRQDRLHGRHR